MVVGVVDGPEADYTTSEEGNGGMGEGGWDPAAVLWPVLLELALVVVGMVLLLWLLRRARRK